ncbi:MAG: Gfo/Idh/MocA family protein [Thermoproteota archaeon]
MEDPLGIGIVGCGGMATLLSKVCLKIPNVKVIAVYDPVEERSSKLASLLECDRCSDASDLFDRPDVKAVIVATPNQTHRSYTVAALEKGKNVFCEKPMALRPEDCDLMIDAAERAKLTLMIGHVMRFYSGCALVKRIIDSGEIGQPIVSSVSRTGWIEVGAWEKSWRRSKEICQNSLFESTIHEIDLMRWFMGDVESVQAYGHNFSHPELDYDDCNLAIIRFRSGALGTLESGYAFRMGEHRIRINGTEGAIKIDFDTSNVRIMSKDKTERVEPLMVEEPYTAELRHFFDCLVEGRKPLTDGREGKRAVEIATAINLSAERLAPVRIS